MFTDNHSAFPESATTFYTDIVLENAVVAGQTGNIHNNENNNTLNPVNKSPQYRMNSAPGSLSKNCHNLQVPDNQSHMTSDSKDAVERRKSRPTLNKAMNASYRRSVSLENIYTEKEESRFTKSLRRIKNTTRSKINVRDVFSSHNLDIHNQKSKSSVLLSTSSQLSKSSLLFYGVSVDPSNLGKYSTEDKS